MLAFSRVSAGFDGVPVLHDISFEVPEGETVALFGHNGAGKTTLLRCAVGDVSATPAVGSDSCPRAITCFAT
ncbi:MAG: ATP-binding cassette domain-containing protein [Rhodospirillales bacterium]|nr:ATP-binding cassette domain-containing protein [Rhodospirillales bacterium]